MIQVWIFWFYGGLLLLAPSFPDSGLLDEPRAALVLEPETVDFGEIFDGDNPLRMVVLRNQGGAPVTIRRLHSTCGCVIPRVIFPGGREVQLSDTYSQGSLGVLEPGQEASMEVGFRTWGYKGRLEKRVVVESDDPVQPRKSLEIMATIIDSVTLVPEKFDLGSVIRGLEKAASVRIRSAGIGAFQIKGIRNLPSYLTYRTKILSAGPETEIELTIETKTDPPLGDWSLELQVALENSYIDTVRVLLSANIVPKVDFHLAQAELSQLIDLGVFAGQKGCEAVVEIVNRVPMIPYIPMNLELASPRFPSFLEHELSTVKEGEHYRLHIRIKPGVPPGAFFLGTLAIESDHPDLLLKKLRIIGWSSRANLN